MPEGLNNTTLSLYVDDTEIYASSNNSRMKSDEIRKLQSERDVLRVRSRKYNTEETWTAFRTIRNKIKSMISRKGLF